MWEELTKHQKRNIFLHLHLVSDIMKYNNDEYQDIDLWLMYKYYVWAFFKNDITQKKPKLILKAFSYPFTHAYDFIKLFFYKKRAIILASFQDL